MSMSTANGNPPVGVFSNTSANVKNVMIAEPVRTDCPVCIYVDCNMLKKKKKMIYPQIGKIHLRTRMIIFCETC